MALRDIEQRPLQLYPGGALALAQALGALFGRLRATPVFPHFVAYPDIVSRLFAHVRRTGLFADGLLDAHMRHLQRVTAALGEHSARMVSCHNDPIPSNILFDGERLWLIDWESAYCNDRLVDVAILLDTLPHSPELPAELLRVWLRRDPDQALIARLALIRTLTRLYYAGVMLSGSAVSWQGPPAGDLSAPTIPEFQRAILDGRLTVGAPDTRHILGNMFLASFLTGGPAPGFDAAVPSTVTQG